ncbi:MAG: heat-inducible transcriptional repressor [Chloroflexota bacterium]|jgi:heat-inducible transcriptional repressor|nr:heat-inducible transcriptional repressor [Chloroflexota bacterium]
MARRTERPAGPLDPRSQQILRAIIEEYIVTAEPVGSQTLVERYGLPVSSATVRNVMAELEEAGYLSHPHTSAGRIPTDAGYRLYVETIAPKISLAPVERLMIRHQFGQVEFASEQWFRLAAATIAGTTHAAGLATPAKPSSCKLRHVDLVATSTHTASLVVVLAEGGVKQELIPIEDGYDQAELDDVARLLNNELADKSALQVADRVTALALDPDAPPLAVRVSQRVERLMREFDAATVEDVFSDGLLNVMSEPEFSQSEKLRRVFAALQNRDYLGSLVARLATAGDVQVLIGGENERPEMHDVSLVLATYGQPGRALGVVGVLGPTRMAYPHAIGTVRFVSGLMNELVEQLYR